MNINPINLFYINNSLNTNSISYKKYCENIIIRFRNKVNTIDDKRELWGLYHQAVPYINGESSMIINERNRQYKKIVLERLLDLNLISKDEFNKYS